MSTQDYFDPVDDDCPVCGHYEEWEDCWQCGGVGDFHDCGEDTCCCLRPEFDERVLCEECGGAGGWWYCPNASRHPEEVPA